MTVDAGTPDREQDIQSLADGWRLIGKMFEQNRLTAEDRDIRWARITDRAAERGVLSRVRLLVSTDPFGNR